MPYVIAAYAIVLATLFGYGLWLAAQRRRWRRREAEEVAASAPPEGRA